MLHVFSDFDGTITSQDSIVFLTEKFGRGSDFRQDILKEIKSRKLSVHEAIRRELVTVKISWNEAARALKENIQVDPTFSDFVTWCRQQGYSLSVLSSGIKRVVSLFIGELDIPIFAHSIEPAQSGWIYQRNESSDKVKVLQHTQKAGKIIYIGDGTSDVEVIPYVDLLFAKSYLAEYCDQEGIPHIPFQSFLNVRNHLVNTSI